MSEKQLKRVDICLLNHSSWPKLSLKQTGVMKKCPKFYENRPKGPVTLWIQLKITKININGLNQILKNTEWSSKNRFLDQCSQSFTSRDESSEYLTRFYTFISNKKL